MVLCRAHVYVCTSSCLPVHAWTSSPNSTLFAQIFAYRSINSSIYLYVCTPRHLHVDMFRIAQGQAICWQIQTCRCSRAPWHVSRISAVSTVSTPSVAFSSRHRDSIHTVCSIDSIHTVDSSATVAPDSIHTVCGRGAMGSGTRLLLRRRHPAPSRLDRPVLHYIMIWYFSLSLSLSLYMYVYMYIYIYIYIYTHTYIYYKRTI